jgi:hypothetical protein
MPELNRPQTPQARDSSLLPTGELDLKPIALGNAGTKALDLTTASTDFVQTLAAAPLILQVISDQDFYEGQAAPDASKNIKRSAGTLYNIPVNGRTGWNFLATSAGANITGKLLTGN